MVFPFKPREAVDLSDRRPPAWNPLSETELKVRAKRKRWERDGPVLETLAGIMIGLPLLVFLPIWLHSRYSGLIEVADGVTTYRADPRAANVFIASSIYAILFAIVLLIRFRRRVFSRPLLAISIAAAWFFISQGMAEDGPGVRVSQDWFSAPVRGVLKNGPAVSIQFENAESFVYVPKGNTRGSRERWICKLNRGKVLNLSWELSPQHLGDTSQIMLARMARRREPGADSDSIRRLNN
jgi:hypothetical protein